MKTKGTGIDVLKLDPEAAGKLKAQGIDTVEMFLAQSSRVGGEVDLCRLLGIGAKDLVSMVEAARKYVDPEFLELLKRPVGPYPMGALFGNADPDDEGSVRQDEP
jgi:hypothetical protein